MSVTIRNNAEIKLSNFVYKYEIAESFGLKTGNIDFWRLFNLRMILDVLTWDDTANYLTDGERDCLVGKLNHNLKTCNC